MSDLDGNGDDGPTDGGDSNTASRPPKKADGQVRRRISRACDQCNQLRTKCDGKFPCAHCVGKFVIMSFDLHLKVTDKRN